MSTPNHTPAPWKSRATDWGKGHSIIDGKGCNIARINPKSPISMTEKQVNARLIAAAPELLKSLKRCALLLADFDEQDDEEGQAYREAMKIISMAEEGS